MFQLPVTITVVDDSGERQLEYDGSNWIIGRADDCDVQLATNKASRKHAEFFEESGHITLVDLGSANGTHVNGQPVERVSLSPGDVIEIGRATVTVGVAPPPEPAPAPAATAASRPASRAAASEQQPEGREAPVRTVVAYTAAPAVTAITLGIPAFLIIILAILIYTQVERKGPFAPTAGNPNVSSGAATPDAPGEPRPGTVYDSPEDLESLREFEILVSRAAAESAGWDLIDEARNLNEAFPGTRGGERARRLITVLESVRRVIDEQDTARAEEAVRSLVEDGSFGPAVTVCRFLARLDETDRNYWEERAEEIDRRATAEFLEIERELGTLIGAGSPDDALRRLVALRAEFGGSARYEEILPRFVDSSLTTLAPSVRDADGEEIDRTLERASVAMAACRFEDLEALYYRVLALGPSTETRVRAYEGLVDAIYLQRMFTDFISKVGEKPVDTAAGRVVRADGEEVVFERDIEGVKIQQAKRWQRIPASTKLALFESVVFTRDGLLGIALFAARNGDLEAERRALVRLYKRGNGRELAEVLAARRRGVAVPPEGFVIHKGQLLTPAERDAEIAARKAAKERERAIARELAEKKRSDKLGTYLDLAEELRREGRFELAHRVLTEVAEKASGETRERALAMADDTFLASHVLRTSGPAENRLDFFILGEGYPIEDDYQEAFLTQARVCMNLLLNEEPYREYQNYLNFGAVQLGSKEAGVDREPGDVKVDSALDGKVEWDVFTVNNGKVMEILGRLDVAGEDRQAIVIGNCDAGVATGGGGVSCMARGNYVPAGHEVGHSLGGLRDEYDTEPGTRPGRQQPERRQNVPTAQLPPNLMVGSNRASVLDRVLWQNWIDAGPEKWWNGSKVEVFEGGNRQPFNVWRPQMSCKMRTASSRFCVVCMEVMVKQFYRRVRPIDALEPERPEVTMSTTDKLHFKVRPMQPLTHELEVEWFLKDLGANKPKTDPEAGSTAVSQEANGEMFRRTLKLQDPAGRWVHVAELRGRKLQPGWFRLRCIVKDPTPWVLHDPEGLLVQQHDWFIEVR